MDSKILNDFDRLSEELEYLQKQLSCICSEHLSDEYYHGCVDKVNLSICCFESAKKLYQAMVLR